jgi:hypothetical protein
MCEKINKKNKKILLASGSAYEENNYNTALGWMRRFVIFRLFQMKKAMLGIRDILVQIRIRIPGSVPLTNGTGSDTFLH